MIQKKRCQLFNESRKLEKFCYGLPPRLNLLFLNFRYLLYLFYSFIHSFVDSLIRSFIYFASQLPVTLYYILISIFSLASKSLRWHCFRYLNHIFIFIFVCLLVSACEKFSTVHVTFHRSLVTLLLTHIKIYSFSFDSCSFFFWILRKANVNDFERNWQQQTEMETNANSYIHLTMI